MIVALPGLFSYPSLTPENRYILKILWKRGDIAPSNFFSFPHYFVTCCHLFVCVEVLRPSPPNGVMSSASVHLTTRILGRLA